ncbi:MAG: TetR/AcrR family transcriptional regulator [Gammaproteobacteria bacterium]|nr:TetR/AcrR family transcriptional regulator [Gammaproteobacteria bacterium]
MTGERKQEILQTAIEIIADEGYGSLSMRALARASDMKLGALQYHFRTWEELLRALVKYIEEEIVQAFESNKSHDEPASVLEIAAFMLDDNAGTEDPLLSDTLWPQLWAMEQVEPLVSDLLEEVYANYVAMLETAMKAAGAESPHAEALCLMSLLEGESLFTGSGRRWESDRKAVRKTILKFVSEKYGEAP